MAINLTFQASETGQNGRLDNSQTPSKGSRLGEFWKYRIGDYRVIARIEDAAVRILVVRVGNRRDVYR